MRADDDDVFDTYVEFSFAIIYAYITNFWYSLKHMMMILCCVFLLCGGCKASDRAEDDVVDEKTQVQEEEDSSHIFGQSPIVRNHSSSGAE